MTKIEKSVYSKKYYKRNRKKISARHKKNRKKRLAYSKKYYKRNRKKGLAYSKKYYKRNRKKVLVNRKKSYKRKNYSMLTPSRHAHMLRRSKTLKSRGIDGRPISLDQYRAKLYYKNGKEKLCHYCHGNNNKMGSGLDRIDSFVNYTMKNTVAACAGCNAWKGRNHSYGETLRHFKPMRDAARDRRI